MTPRDYQQAAFDAVLSSLRAGNNPVASIPTGGGKALISAMLVDRFRARSGYTLLLTQARELVQQNFNTLDRYSDTSGVGIYSAGLGKWDIGQYATFATVQSIYKKLDLLPEPSVILVDECQNVAPKEADAVMYNAIMKRFPNARRVGLSATPYRLDTGLVYKGEGCHFDDLAIDIKIKDLTTRGYLSPLVGLVSANHLEVENLSLVGGDYDPAEIDSLITQGWLSELIRNVEYLATGRKAWLMFAPSVRVAALAARIANDLNIPSDYVYGGDQNRRDKLKKWESGETKLMVNCQLLTVGYDRPDIDCIIDAAPTESLGKHIQKLGRGTRLHETKKNCLVIDACGNMIRLGSVSQENNFYIQKPKGEVEAGEIIPRKPSKLKRVFPGVKTLPALDPMTGEQAKNGSTLTVEVHGCGAVPIKTRRDPERPVLMVSYACTTPEGARIDATLFVNTERPTEADKLFFKNRRLAVNLPALAGTVQWAVRNSRIPRYLTVRKSGKYWNVTAEHFQQPQE